VGNFTPAGGLAISRQFPADQTDIFSIDQNGQLNVFWVVVGGLWNGPQLIGPANLCVPGSPIAASQQFGLLGQTDVFVVDRQGRLCVIWLDVDHRPQGPLAITPPGAVPLGASLAVSQQIGLNQTDVFFVDANGQVNVCWVDNGGQWQGPAPLGPLGLAPPGCPLAASQQFGLNQTNVYLVSKSGQPNVLWVDGAGVWQGPAPIGPSGFATPGSHVAACQQSTLNQTDLFVIDKNGGLAVFWVSNGGAWKGPLSIGQTGLARPGSSIAALAPPGLNQTRVFIVDKEGQLVLSWVVGGDAWQQKIIGDNAQPGSLLATSPQFGLAQTDLFWIDQSGNINVTWGDNANAWLGPQILRFPASWPTNKPIADALSEIVANGPICASFYLDTQEYMARGTGYGGDHAQGIARTRKLGDGSIAFFLSYSKIGGQGSISTYRYAGPTDGDHISEQFRHTDPGAVAPQTQVQPVPDEHPADMVFLPETNGADAGYLFVTEPNIARTLQVFRWDKATGLQNIKIPDGLFVFGGIFQDNQGPDFIFLDRVGDSYYLGVAGFDMKPVGLLFCAQGDELFPPGLAGQIALNAFKPVAQSDITQNLLGLSGNLFAFPVDQDACQIKLVQDSTGEWFLLGFRENPPSETEGIDYVDVYPVTFSPFSISAPMPPVHIYFRPGDTGFSSTGTHFVDESGRLMVSSSYRWSEEESNATGAGYVSRVDELSSS
jgi:hypothetical protein